MTQAQPQTQIQKAPPPGGQLGVILTSPAMQKQISLALPKHCNAERIARIALTTLTSNPKLADCTPASFFGSLLQAAQLGLECNTPLGHAYLLPFRDNKRNVTLCQLIIGYQGMLDLSRRSSNVKAIYAHPVYEGDEFRYELGLEPKLVHKPLDTQDRRAKKLTHVYAVARLNEGEPIFTVLTQADVETYRARSRAKGDGPWVTDYEAMALKTAIRRLFRWLPKSAEVATAVAVDESLEIGKRQELEWDPNISGMLADQGIEVDAIEAGESVPVPDVESGSKQAVMALVDKHGKKTKERQPGEDG